MQTYNNDLPETRKENMEWGGYALGTGNSVPEYVPESHYEAMIRCVLDA